ncbi:MAG: NTP transferase domain-containing protein [Alphaproteobacteria bacterium]|nr:NTP transferase domain-containing protein [Alphaproteobacteria bacterium]
MTTAAIVQARTPSRYDEALILQELGSKTVLIRTLDRCAEIPGVDQVICAIPDSEADTQLALEILRHGHLLSVGPGEDLLANCTHAAEDFGVETVVSISASNPFIDPQICGRVLNLFRDSRADFACNDLPRLFPAGLECSVFSSLLLAEADRVARDGDERASVTRWMREHALLHKANLRGPGGGLEALDWHISDAESLDLCQAIYDEVGERAATMSAAELAALCLRRPDLTRSRPVEGGKAAPVIELSADVETAVASLNIAA